MSGFMAFKGMQKQQMAYADSSNKIFSWGSNRFGQLGQGNAKLNSAESTIVSDLEDMEIKCVAASGEISAAINSFGELYTWGSAKNGA